MTEETNKPVSESGKDGALRFVKKYVLRGIVSTFVISFIMMRLTSMCARWAIKAFTPGAAQVLSPLFDTDGVSYLLLYSMFGIGFVICLVITYVVKPWRPFLRSMGPEADGNTPKMLAVGLGVGLLLNSACIGIAVAAGNIQGFELEAVQPVQVVMFVIAVLIQCGFEEFSARCFAYQRILRAYGPVAAVVGSSLVFSAAHMFNQGITPLALGTIFVCGVAFSLAVYRLNSFWMAVGMHAGWNFCQGVLFGLPNSGTPTGYAVFRPVGDVTSGIAYDNVFGVEGTVFALLALGLTAVAIVAWSKKHPRKRFDVMAD